MEAVYSEIRRKFPREVCPGEVLPWLADNRSDCFSVAFSGGPDSLFLLLWLKAHFPRRMELAGVLHFNHQTRPEENAAEAQLVSDWVGRLGLSIELGVREGGEGHSEDEMRRARFGFFQSEMERSGSKLLFLGHNADDVAETLLARLARGSGPEGLAAPRPVSHHAEEWEHHRVRPLLNISGSAIREFLSGEGLVSAEDSSNTSEAYERNRIRSRVLPAWKEAVDRDLLIGITRSRTLLAETVEFLELAARSLVPEGWGQERLEISVLRASHPAPVRFLLQRWLGRRGETVSPEVIEAIVRAVFGSVSGRWSVGADRWVILNERELFVGESSDSPTWNPIRWAEGMTIYLPDGSSLRRERVGADPNFYEKVVRGEGTGPHRVYLRGGEGTPPILEVRLWRPGDRFRPLGAPGTRKLQDCFTDRKMAPVLRRRLPIILAEGEIVWVPGFPPAEAARIESPNESLLGLTYEPS